MTTEPAGESTGPAKRLGTDDMTLAERLLRRIGRVASPEAVFGAPITAHGRTIIPVARAYVALGAGGGRGESRAGREDPEALGAGSGGGAGGAGFTLASGYIEISAEGTRYVAVASNRDRLIGIA